MRRRRRRGGEEGEDGHGGLVGLGQVSAALATVLAVLRFLKSGSHTSLESFNGRQEGGSERRAPIGNAFPVGLSSICLGTPTWVIPLFGTK